VLRRGFNLGGFYYVFTWYGLTDHKNGILAAFSDRLLPVSIPAFVLMATTIGDKYELELLEVFRFKLSLSSDCHLRHDARSPLFRRIQ